MKEDQMAMPIRERLLNVLLADDGSVDARAAADLLASLPHSRDSHITVLRIFTPLQIGEVSLIEETLHRTRDLLKSRHMHVHTELLLGYPSEKILEYAEEHHPDIVVMGARGLRSAIGLQLGGVAMHLAEDGRWPVLVVRSPYRPLKRVLMVTDGSDASSVACEYLGRFPLPDQIEVRVAHVLPPEHPAVYVDPFAGSMPLITDEELAEQNARETEDGKKILVEAINCLNRNSLAADMVLLRGDAAEEIMKYAREEQIDLIVAGSNGLGPVRAWLLGSVTRKLVHYSDRSLLIVRRLVHG
jgi:nucleotide-binding universal stress UspA family protein